MLYPLESKKELSESGTPFPTRQLSIYAEQLENSPATQIYKKEKFQAWLARWCTPPFGAWDALAVAKSSFVGFGPFARHFASACAHLLGWGAGCACPQTLLWFSSKRLETVLA